MTALHGCTDGELSAHVRAVYPHGDAIKALRDAAARKVMGKAILRSIT